MRNKNYKRAARSALTLTVFWTEFNQIKLVWKVRCEGRLRKGLLGWSKVTSVIMVIG